MLSSPQELHRIGLAFRFWLVMALVMGLLFAISAGAAIPTKFEPKNKETNVGYNTDLANANFKLVEGTP